MIMENDIKREPRSKYSDNNLLAQTLRLTNVQTTEQVRQEAEFSSSRDEDASQTFNDIASPIAQMARGVKGQDVNEVMSTE